MTTYDGFCRGGPWDGKLWSGPKPILKINVFNDSVEKVSGEVPPDIKPGEYRHVLGQWIWHDLSSV